MKSEELSRVLTVVEIERDDELENTIVSLLSSLIVEQTIEESSNG